MKQWILSAAALGSTLGLAQSMTLEKFQDGQILSVEGHINQMPRVIDEDAKPEDILPLHIVTVTVAAWSGGCTEADHFKLELNELSPQLYRVAATRVLEDDCKKRLEWITLEKKLEMPLELLKKVEKNEVHLLTKPYVTVEISQ